MKKKTYFKNTLRDMGDTKGKIFSIFVMIFLASAVIVGLFITGPSMRKTLNQTLKNYNHPDITVTSTYGLEIEDQVIIEKDPDIDEVYYGKIYDAFLSDDLIRIKSYNEDTPKIDLSEGKYPENNKEIILDDKLKDDFELGDKLTFKSPTDEKIDESLENDTYELVGFVKSSEYLFNDIRDVSLTGKKMTDGFALVHEDNFKKDTLAQANVYYKQSKDQDFFSDDYMDFIKDKKKYMEDSLENRPEEVLAEIKEDANKELDEAQEELEDSEKELDDKEKELLDASRSLTQGFEDYEAGKKEFNDQMAQGQRELEAAKAQLDQGQRELDQGRIEYQNSLDEFYSTTNAKQAEIDQARKKLESGQKELDQGKKSYQENLGKVDQGFEEKKKELNLLEESLNQEEKALKEGEASLENDLVQMEELKTSLEDLDPTSEEYLETLGEMELLKTGIEEKKSGLEAKTKIFKEKSYKYQIGKTQMDEAYKEAMKPLDEAKTELDQKQALINTKKKELDQGQNLLNQNKAQAEEKLAQARNELNANEKALQDGYNEYYEGVNTLEANRIQGEEKLKSSYAELVANLDDYQEGKKEFDEKAPDARKEIADGKEEIEDERKKLVNLRKPDYEVGINRDNEAIKTYYNNSKNMDELTKVFPTFFYFVAILVTLTTMKRYIEEQRTQVGTLKSLGYTNRDIANKFYVYGLVPTLFGAIFGSIFGKYILTSVIFKAYSTSFNVLDLQYSDTFIVILLTIILSMLVIYLTIFITNRKTVKEVPANLLRGKAPKKGSRIFLEKIDFIWNRLSFMKKITFRNIFRYKSRMYMTLFGVAGCTALLFFGFAMQDSVQDTSIMQRNDISHYDAIAVYDTKADQKDLDSLENTLDKVDSTKLVYQEGDAKLDDSSLSVNLMAFEDNEDVEDFINIKDLDGNPLKIDDKGAIITDNLSKKQDLDLGDELNFKDKDGDIRTLEVTGIAENYMEDYIYISKNQYEQAFNKKADYNASLIVTDDDDYMKDLEGEEAILTIIKPNSMYETMDVLMDNLNLVIVIITLVSSVLAIVVLFNLNNINVSERIRELATVKVLGFYPKETTAYIYRETFLLTLIGVIFGYGLGYIMFRYVLDVVAPEGVLLAYHPYPRSFILSAGITFLISIVIMFVVHKKLKNIDMAEAMMSGE